MDTVYRILPFILRNIKNPLYIVRYALAFPRKDFVKDVSFFSNEQFMEMLHQGKSLIRLGDGEVYMMNFGSIPQYEYYDANLRKYFLRMIREYSPSSPYILGIPKMVNMTNMELREIGKLNCWLPLKILYANVFPHDVNYFDAHLFYREGGFDIALRSILENHKIIIVTQKDNIRLLKEASVEKKLDVVFIETPARDSFRRVEEIADKIRSAVAGNKTNCRVVLATGPASKVLVYKLSKEGIISYDIGRGIETVYRKNEIENLI